MRLGEVLNKIFRKRNSKELTDRNISPAENIYKPDEHQSDDDSRFKKIVDHIASEQGEQFTTELERKKKVNKFIIIGVSAVVIAVIVSLVSIIYMRITNSAFRDYKVSIAISGPEVVTVGEDVEYSIVMENSNRVDLNDVVIGLILPDNFKIKENSFVVDKNLSGARIDVGTIKKNSKKEYKIKTKVGYINDSMLTMKVFSKYTPSNMSSFFQTDTVRNLRLDKSAIDISIFSPGEVSDGELIELKLAVDNLGSDSFDEILLKIDYPEDFSFESASLIPENENKNTWKITNLNANSQREIKILGRLFGAVDMVKKFRVVVLKKENNEEMLTKGVGSVRIIPNKVILTQETNDKNIRPGDYVKYKISFKNNSATILRNLILRTHLPGKFIKRNNIKHQGGYYDDKENSVVWKSSDVKKLKELQPGEEGSVEVLVQLQDEILPNGTKNKDPYLRIFSEIDSLDVDSPIFENKKVTSQQTKILISSIVKVGVSIKYLPDDNGNVEKGVLQVGRKMFLRVNLEMKNTTSDLKNAELTASFPSGVTWEKQIYPKGDNLDFRSRSNKLEWQLGLVKNGTGFTSPSEKAEFVIGVTPSVNQVGNIIDLINSIEVTAEDTFTGEDIKYKFNVIKSNSVKNLDEEGAVIESEEL